MGRMPPSTNSWINAWSALEKSDLLLLIAGRSRLADAGVVLTATNTLMAETAQDWSTPAGQQLIGLLFSDVFPALGAGIA